MATERQIQANRENALKSTGPKTDEGKARSRANAVKHGLSGAGAVLAEDDQAAVEARKAEWAGGHDLAAPERAWAFHLMVAASIQLDRAEAAATVHRREFAARAADAWDEDRRSEAEAEAARLARGPGRSLRRLEATRHGVEVLIARWTRLGQAIEAGGDWDEAERSHALDLLGLPADLRRGPTPLDAPEGSDSAGFRRALVAQQVAHLDGRREALDRLDAMHREHAELSFGAELSKTGALIRRYEREAWNRFFRASGELRPAERPAPKARESTASLSRQLERALSEAAPPKPRPTAVAHPAIEAALAATSPDPRPRRPEVSTGGSPFVEWVAAPPSLNRRERRAAQKAARRG